MDETHSDDEPEDSGPIECPRCGRLSAMELFDGGGCCSSCGNTWSDSVLDELPENTGEDDYDEVAAAWRDANAEELIREGRDVTDNTLDDDDDVANQDLDEDGDA